MERGGEGARREMSEDRTHLAGRAFGIKSMQEPATRSVSTAKGFRMKETMLPKQGIGIIAANGCNVKNN